MAGRAELALIGVCAVWGATFTVMQDATELMPVFAFLGWRFTAAALIVLPFVWRELRRVSWRAGIAMGVFLTGGYVFQTFALAHTTASNAGFITGLFVVITPLLAAFILRERIGTVAWIAAAVSAVGLFLLSGANGLNEGDGLALLCAVSLSFHILVTARGARDNPVGGLLVIQLGFVGVFCLAAATAEGRLEAPHDGEVWSALVITAVFASALGFFVQTYAQRHAPPARTALILASEPAFAGLFGYLVAGDRLDAIAWLGAALIMAAIVTVELIPRWRPPRPLPEG